MTDELATHNVVLDRLVDENTQAADLRAIWRKQNPVFRVRLRLKALKAQ